jgi:hypothetical protein
MPDQPLSRLSITAQQADAVAALARLYMSTEVLTISQGSDLAGYIIAATRKWEWMIDEKGRVAGERAAVEGATDAF